MFETFMAKVKGHDGLTAPSVGEDDPQWTSLWPYWPDRELL